MHRTRFHYGKKGKKRSTLYLQGVLNAVREVLESAQWDAVIRT